MSFINFESTSEIRQKREWEREVRQNILDKVKEEHGKVRLQEEARQRGEHSWMLPSVAAQLTSKKHSKKKKKKKHKKHKKKRSSSSSSSESESEEEKLVWVEKKITATDDGKSVPQQKLDLEKHPVKREEWMEVSSLLKTYSREDLAQEGTSRKMQKAEERRREEQTKQNIARARELNPFYKGGGSGLPTTEQPETSSTPAVSADWLRKALRRAKEQAEEEGRTLEEVAAQRWGSLDRLNELLREAERANKRVETGRRDGIGDRISRGEHREKSESRSPERQRKKYREDEQRIYVQKEGDTHKVSWHRDRATSSDDAKRPSLTFRKPELRDHHSLNTVTECTARGKWRKKAPSPERKSPVVKDVHLTDEVPKPSVDQELHKLMKDKDSVGKLKEEERAGKDNLSTIKEEEHSRVLTDTEMNRLAAKVLRAELAGKDELAQKLKARLEKARQVRTSANITSLPDNSKPVQEVVVLTRTDARGFTRPVSLGTTYSKRGNVVSHQPDGKRTLYFPDDDRYDLKTMFEKEKGISAAEHNALFEAAAARNREKLDDDFDVDDMFISKKALKEDLAKQQEREKQRAITEHQTRQRTLDSCPWCFENKNMAKNLIVSLGKKCYLCLPSHESLTQGQCMIVPIHHVTCSTQADEDLWEEIMLFRRSLVTFYDSVGEDCVFYEMAIRLHRYPHMVVHCVPMERSVGELAPIYFKKALEDCDEEWAQNKKVVDLRGRDVRRAVPKGLPYFFIDFGLSPGFAHVIENDRLFKNYFAEEVIGGMIDAEPNLWRKPRRENFDAQKRKVIEFSDKFKDFDPKL